MKKIILTLFLSSSVCFSYASSFLLLTDIHFNPFAECNPETLPCPSLTHLITAPIQDWPKTFNTEPLPSLKQDVNNTFLTIGLNSLSQTVSNQKLNGIFITGDLLSHNFATTYATYAPSSANNQADLSAFSLKTMEYVLNQVHASFPQQPIYFTLGNNDTDLGDYSLPSADFLKKLGSDLSTLVPNSANMQHTFAEGGFYSLPISKSLILIGLNINLLSQTNPNMQEAIFQLNWLDAVLQQAEFAHKKVIIIQHIPFGMDLYKSAQGEGNPFPLLESNLQAQYLSLLQHYSDCIDGIYAGHYHMDYFGLINNDVPLIGTLGFSPIFGNNPGLKILNLDDDGYFLGYTTYVATPNPTSITWNVLYEFSKIYGQPTHFVDMLQHFPKDLNSPQVVSYRSFFNGNQPAYPQPISQDKNWKYYYCGISNMNLTSYKQCLNSM